MQIIVSENRANQDREINFIRSLTTSLNNELNKFKEETGYSFEMSDILTAINSSPTAAEEALNKKFDEFLDSELDGTNVQSNFMRRNFKLGYKNVISILVADLKKISNMPGIEHLSSLTVENGNFVMSSEYEQQVRNSFRNIIKTEKAREFWTLQNQAAVKLQELSTFINENVPKEYFSNLSTMPQSLFEIHSTGHVEVKKLAYEKLVGDMTEIKRLFLNAQ